jgi:hypothetical protein
MNRWVRAGIGFLAASQTVVGVWALFFPVNFFSLEIVGMGMAYNEHLMRDYGAMTLASAVVLGVATVHMGRMLTVCRASHHARSPRSINGCRADHGTRSGGGAVGGVAGVCGVERRNAWPGAIDMSCCPVRSVPGRAPEAWKRD